MDADVTIENGPVAAYRPAGETRRSDCPNCGNDRCLLNFYEVQRVPTHSVLLMSSREEALAYPKRDVQLAVCQRCGFILNRVFDPTVHEYSARYEETQGFSDTFNAFSDRLAQQLIERHNLRGKRVIEIGCGKGEFLTHLCELGENWGLGFDPAYVPDRSRAEPSSRVTFIKDFYSDAYARHSADFYICKMTLEHIHETREFVSMIRRATGANADSIVFFQVPDVTRVLEEGAFWDIYYEHCSYFDAGSLRYLFESTGFDVLDVWNDYHGQYLMIEARPAPIDEVRFDESNPGHPERLSLLEHFIRHTRIVSSEWRQYLDEMHSDHRTVVLWGGGSKAVAFLSTLGISDEVSCAVDINPHKRGTFLPGTGHEVVGPDQLIPIKPDAVIVMNPVYHGEIRNALTRLGLEPALIPITMYSELSRVDGMDF